jgi:hypothetical protein
MTRLRQIELLLVPAQTYVGAAIVPLTTELADEHIHRAWWNDHALKEDFDEPPIDLGWNWNELGIEYHGRSLAAEKFAVFSGGTIQGAMMISTDHVSSVIEPGKLALFVELLFTAARNRPNLRKDGKEFLKGVGLQLLIWAARLSREKGHAGRLMLDGSPDYVRWYQNRGLQILPLNPIVYQGVAYTPMELPELPANKLLALWGE